MTIEDIQAVNQLKLITITERLKDRKYLSVDEEEEYMQEVYDSTIGDIENFAFLTPNWINKEKEIRIRDI